MKKILSLLLGIVLVLTLVGCNRDKTTKQIITTDTTEVKTTETKPTTTEKQTTTVNPDIDPWYEDEYKEVDRIFVMSDDNYYIYEREIRSTTTIKLSEDETIDVINAMASWSDVPGPDGTFGWLSYELVYYNPVQKKVKIVRTALSFNYYEKDDKGNLTYITLAYYNEEGLVDDYSLCNTTYIDLSAYTNIQFLKYLEN